MTNVIDGASGGHGFAAGQAWHYRAPVGFEQSRLVIGALITFETGAIVACCSVLDAPGLGPDNLARPTSIPFIPMAIEALAASVVSIAEPAEPAEAFADAFEAWRCHPKGLGVYTVPFEGSLDRMVALQMARIAGVDV